MAARWQEDAIALNPDIISILIGTNDVGAYEDLCKRNDTPFTVEGFDFNGWEQCYRSLLDSTRAALPDVQLFLCTPFAGKARGEVRVAITNRLAQIVSRLAEDYGCVLVPFDDLFSSLQQDEPNEKYWIWDGVHPTAAGHLRMSELWIKVAEEKGVNMADKVR